VGHVTGVDNETPPVTVMSAGVKVSSHYTSTRVRPTDSPTVSTDVIRRRRSSLVLVVSCRSRCSCTSRRRGCCGCCCFLSSP